MNCKLLFLKLLFILSSAAFSFETENPLLETLQWRDSKHIQSDSRRWMFRNEVKFRRFKDIEDIVTENMRPNRDLNVQYSDSQNNQLDMEHLDHNVIDVM